MVLLQSVKECKREKEEREAIQHAVKEERICMFKAHCLTMNTSFCVI